MKLPIIEAVKNKIGGQLTFWCVHCRCWHFHGIGDGPRTAHCFRQHGPYQDGYYLKEVEGEVEWLKQRALGRGQSHLPEVVAEEAPVFHGWRIPW